MIYIDENTTSITLPIIGGGVAHSFTVTNKQMNVEFDIEFELSINSKFYSVISVNLPSDMKVGEYDYTVKDEDGKVLLVDMLTYGDYTPDITKYDNQYTNIVYEG